MTEDTAHLFSKIFYNQPDSRIDRFIKKFDLEGVAASLPEPIRHTVAHRRNPSFRMALLFRVQDVGEYGLCSSERLNCIFVHIPKAAGISVTAGLFGNRGGGHLPLSIYLWLYGAKKFDAMFKFTFVRHPEARIISAYHFLSAGGINKDDQSWANKWLKSCNSLDEFIMERLSIPEVFQSLHFRPQVWFLEDPRSGRIGVDFLGRLENFSSDASYIMEKLNVAVNFSVMNTSAREKEHTLIGRDSRQLIEDLYAADYNTLSY